VTCPSDGALALGTAGGPDARAAVYTFRPTEGVVLTAAVRTHARVTGSGRNARRVGDTRAAETPVGPASDVGPFSDAAVVIRTRGRRVFHGRRT